MSVLPLRLITDTLWRYPALARQTLTTSLYVARLPGYYPPWTRSVRSNPITVIYILPAVQSSYTAIDILPTYTCRFMSLLYLLRHYLDIRVAT
jgi:hypothetical protein